MPDLQKWQTQLLKVNDLDKFQVFAKKVQRLTDGGVSQKAQPESYTEIVKAAQAIADSLTSMGAGSPGVHLHEHAGSAELQEYMAKYRRLVQLLLPYWQGKSVTDCDAGAAVEIQEHIESMRPVRPARLYMDFENSRYFLEGSEVTLEEAFASGIVDFTRLSKAWQFEQGRLEEYEVNEPRFSGKGLLIEPEQQNRFPTTLFKKVSGLDKTQVVDDYFLSDSFKSTKLIGVAQDVEDKTNGYWYKSRVDVSREDGEFSLKRVGFSIDLSKSGSVRYVRFGTFQSFGNTAVHPAIVDTVSMQILFESSAGPKDIKLTKYGELVFVSFLSRTTVGIYNTLSVQFGLEGDNWEDRSTWRALPEGEEILLNCQQWINDFDKPLLSVIPSVSTPTTRLPDTLKVSHEGAVEVEADEGIQVNDNEITGFGYIRKLEVK